MASEMSKGLPLSNRRIVWLGFMSLVTFSALASGFWIPALLGFASIAAAVPWSRVPIAVAKDTANSASPQTRDAKWLSYLAIVLGFVTIMAIGAAQSSKPEGKAEAQLRERERAGDEKEERIAKALEAAKERSERQRVLSAKQEERRKGVNCLSGWDGAHRPTKDAVKEQLRNPGSFEHIETAITPVDSKGQHNVIMKYRAENGFGGLNVEHAIAIIDGETCNLVHLTL